MAVKDLVRVISPFSTVSTGSGLSCWGVTVALPSSPALLGLPLPSVSHTVAAVYGPKKYKQCNQYFACSSSSVT